MDTMTRNGLRPLLEKIRAAAQVLNHQDLVGLAEFHTLCQDLASASAAGEPSSDKQVSGVARQLVKTAEELILASCSDPEAALADIRSRIASLDDASPAPELSSAGVGTSPAPAAVIDPCALGEVALSLVQQLQAAVAQVVEDDLPVLAKMHGWCVALQKDFAGNPPAPASIASALGELHQHLEQLILGTCDDAAAGLTEVKRLVETVGGRSAVVESSGAAAGEASPTEAGPLSDVDVAAQLAKVFGDEPEIPALEAEALGAAAATAAAELCETPAAETQPPYVPEPLRIDPKELEFVAAFVEEAKEHVEAIEAALLEVEQHIGDADKINELFRPFHTIKGMAGFLNLRDVNALTHEAETLLDQGRRGERKISPGIIDIIFSVVDVVKAQISAIGSEVVAPTQGEITMPPVAGLIDHLRGVVARRINPDAGERAARPVVAAQVTEEESADEIQEAETSAPASAAPAATGAAATSPSPAAQATPAAAAAGADQSVRIDTSKLDALVDLVGELVIAQTLVSSSTQVHQDAKLGRDTAQVSKIVRDVQEIAMAMRMVPIKGTFQKMARLVRDLTRKANKKVDLIIGGEETELDKNVIQQIGDPLVHMVRNAMDHGIEPAEKRRAAGKPETGKLHLNAFHHSGNIVVEVRDDGKGLDPAALVAKAIEKGLIRPDEELTDEQAYQLIFAPGFSTAAVITDISGRGVGMDVVKRNIENLRGKVEIESEMGKGTRFCIRLPLTLAIIDGMLVRLGSERFIIPTTSIEQSLRPQPTQISTVQNRGEMLRTRKQLVPLVQLGEMFRLTGRLDPTATMVLITHTDCGEVGLVVDELIGQQQVVIKALGEQFRRLPGITGAAILGDGRVGLILDPSGVRAGWDRWKASTIRPASTAPANAEVAETAQPPAEELVGAGVEA